MTQTDVLLTKSGMFVREDEGFGLLVYSPFLGLVFACPMEHAEAIVKWLGNKGRKCPSAEYEKTLGPGWTTSMKDVEYPVTHLLPNPAAWKILPNPKRPILINWLLTGNCPLACPYCYAEDLMRGKCPEPTEDDVEHTVKAILSFQPLVVVLTGGDPLFSPHLSKAIALLHGNTGIIVDTNAYVFNNEHLDLFKRHNVYVRISFDSERPQINSKLRPVNKAYPKLRVLHPSTMEAAVKAICQCVEANVSVTVQTVATTRNFSDLEALGDTLFKIGVNGWRILIVAPSKERYAVYEKLIGSRKTRNRFYEYVLDKVYSKYEKDWHRRMAVQVAHNRTANAVILVSPDGSFYTESNVEHGGKVILDADYPNNPRLDLVLQKVNIQSHAERYLNLDLGRPGEGNV